LLGFFAAERLADEPFRSWVARVGKKTIKERLRDLMAVPSYEEDPTFYVDWHDAREYSVGDIGVGECAGEVVSLTQFSLAAAEAKVFDASLVVDDPATTEAGVQEATRMAYAAMVIAAQGLVKTWDADINPDADLVFEAFRVRLIETQLFFERYIGASEWQYFQAAHQSRGAARDRDEARRRVEEAQLFIEASHACYSRLLQSRTAPSAITPAVSTPTEEAR
jgi:sulfite reductase (ferredoxin)